MSKKPEKEYYCFKCEKPPINTKVRIKFVADGTGEKRIMDYETGKPHVHLIAEVEETPQPGDKVQIKCPKCYSTVMTIRGQKGFYDDADCSTIHECQVKTEEKPDPSMFATGEEFTVKFTSAADLPNIPNFYRVTKIIVSREDNKWFSAEESDKHYGTGKAKTDGYGKKPSVTLEAKVQTSDRLTIENVMEDLATMIRIHNKKEMQQ